jgi:hypothetical protein
MQEEQMGEAPKQRWQASAAGDANGHRRACESRAKIHLHL